MEGISLLGFVQLVDLAEQGFFEYLVTIFGYKCRWLIQPNVGHVDLFFYFVLAEGESEKELLSSRSEDGEREVENSTEGSNNNNKYYNKNVSFFDKISYNVIEAG